MDKEEQHFNGSFSTPFSHHLNYNNLLNHHQYLSTPLSPNHKLHHCTPQTQHQEEELMESLMKLPAIGLKLQISPSLLKQMQRSTLSKRKRIINNARTDHHDGERLKASILGALMLQIGSWQLVAKNEGDLVAKFYFAKRQLVWEILRNGLKQKIEIEWSNIIGIQAFLEEDKPGILEVELNHPPKFYKEIEPEPRKHTQWTDGSDFTEGQAYVNRRHCIVFPPKVLDKHYEKLKDKDKHLFELSRRPFPTLHFSYFSSEVAFNNQISSIIQFEDIMFNQIPSFPPHLSANEIHSLTSPKSVVDYNTPHFNEIITHQDERMEVLNKGNSMRRYEAEASSTNYYNNHGLDNANPMASMFWLGQNGEAAAATNYLSHQQNKSYYDDNIEYCFNGSVMDMRTPQLPSGHFF
ncbi:uncharacterized protein LOC105436206 [Cucumis sativus]|uniref:TRF2/HOY1 PH-like domain-containing protein n=1 Tax=Cucumis sativus TaxID=3659 RepID=A0A0A0M1F5_CUCSA|nr:uncharacterized protein LOC105436206 [Cucumis sativus]